jgi:hypothetical protein
VVQADHVDRVTVSLGGSAVVLNVFKRAPTSRLCENEQLTHRNVSALHVTFIARADPRSTPAPVLDITNDRLIVDSMTIRLPRTSWATANGSAKRAWQQTL